MITTSASMHDYVYITYPELVVIVYYFNYIIETLITDLCVIC